MNSGPCNPPIIPDHELLRLIGRGSYGEVWLARNALGTYRAVKIIYQSTFRNLRPFERELRGIEKFEPVSRLHSGLIGILQVGHNKEGGFFYCVMEVADDISSGQQIDPLTYTPRTLAREAAQHQRLPVETCLNVGLGVASALSFLHERKLIHRDVKPSNIVFVNGVPKLGDIGLVVEMTEARSYVGTEGFIPPEGPGTVQADIYSFGKVLYEITTGKDRYDYPELPTFLDQTEHSPDLVCLNQVILKCCRAEARKRYASCEEIIADLTAIQSGTAPINHGKARRAWPAAVALIICSLLLLTMISAGTHQDNAAIALTHSQETRSAISGLVGLWRAEGSARDSVGACETVPTSGVSYSQGKVGLAFDFDGIGSAVTASFSNRLESLTLATWIMPKDIGLPRPILEYGGSDGKHSPLHIWYNLTPGINGVPGSLYAAVRAGKNEGIELGTQGGLIRPYEWSHVALTFDSPSRTAWLYVNGIARASNTSPVSIRVNTSLPLHFGYRSGSTADLWAGWRHLGKMDEIYLFNRALSAAEVMELYSAGEGVPQPRPSRAKRPAGH